MYPKETVNESTGRYDDYGALMLRIASFLKAKMCYEDGKRGYVMEEEGFARPDILPQTTAFSALAFALAYQLSQDREWINLALGCLRHLISKQGQNGRWSSWSATAFVNDLVSECFTRLGSEIEASLQVAMKRALLKASIGLAKVTHIPNQESISALGITRVGFLLKNDKLISMGKKKMTRVLELRTRENIWTEEWGPSVVYHVVTMASVIRLAQLLGDTEMIDCVTKSADFPLYLQNENGNFAYLGRSGQFVFAYPTFAFVFESLARITKQGRFKRAAKLALKRLADIYFAEDGGLKKSPYGKTLIKEYGGRVTYSAWSACYIGFAAEVASELPQGPIPSEHGHFVKTFHSIETLVVKTSKYFGVFCGEGYKQFSNYLSPGLVIYVSQGGREIMDTPLTGEEWYEKTRPFAMEVSSYNQVPRNPIEASGSVLSTSGRACHVAIAGRSVIMRTLAFHDGFIAVTDKVLVSSVRPYRLTQRFMFVQPESIFLRKEECDVHFRDGAKIRVLSSGTLRPVKEHPIPTQSGLQSRLDICARLERYGKITTFLVLDSKNGHLYSSFSPPSIDHSLAVRALGKALIRTILQFLHIRVMKSQT